METCGRSDSPAWERAFRFNRITSLLNRVEAVIRAFYPRVSCSTYANGHLALRVELRAADGSLLEEMWSH